MPTTVYQNASGSFATNTLLQSTSALLTPLTLTNTLTGQLVLNTNFDLYKTNVASATATLLPATIYQSASGSFATNTLFQSTSALLTPLTLTNTLTSQLVLNTNFDLYKTNVAAATATLLPATIYQSASGNWQDTFTNVQSNSANWDFGYDVATYVQANSADWEESADITAITTTVASNSGNWNIGYDVATTYQSVSGSFATNTLLQSTSALLTPLTLTNTLTSQLVLNTNFDLYKTNVAAATALFTPLTLTNTLTGQINSSIIPTVTNYLSTNNVQISSLNITDSLSTSVQVTNFATSKTFLSSDTSRVFHFNTTTQSLCAIFPNALPNGFNVAVMNTGTNGLVLSASQLNSVGNVLSVQYGGAFVYKDNNQLFAVGRL